MKTQLENIISSQGLQLMSTGSMFYDLMYKPYP